VAIQKGPILLKVKELTEIEQKIKKNIKSNLGFLLERTNRCYVEYTCIAGYGYLFKTVKNRMRKK
jgi:hypothetical protein